MDLKEINMMLPACSCMTLTSQRGNPYWFRTCDIEADFWEKGAHVVQQAAGGRLRYGNGSTEEAKYSYMGITYNRMDTWLLDGVNQWGLAGGLLMLYEGTGVDKPQEGKAGYVGMELVTKMLSSCKDVKDVIALAKQTLILNIPYGEQTVAAAMHYFFADVSGNEVILEAADTKRPGELRIYYREEILGVMTNSPIYEKQLQNLSWFLSQSPEMKQGFQGKPLTELCFDGRRIRMDEKAPHVSETGIFPASYASYDRFIRLSVLKALNNSGNCMEDEKILALGSNLMNAVNEPCHGGLFHYTNREEDGTIVGQKDSFTQYLIMYDLKHKGFYLKVFDMVNWIQYQWTELPPGEKKSYEIKHEPMKGILKGNGD